MGGAKNVRFEYIAVVQEQEEARLGVCGEGGRWQAAWQDLLGRGRSWKRLRLRKEEEAAKAAQCSVKDHAEQADAVAKEAMGARCQGVEIQTV